MSTDSVTAIMNCFAGIADVESVKLALQEVGRHFPGRQDQHDGPGGKQTGRAVKDLGSITFDLMVHGWHQTKQNA